MNVIKYLQIVDNPTTAADYNNKYNSHLHSPVNGTFAYKKHYSYVYCNYKITGEQLERPREKVLTIQRQRESTNNT